MINFFYSTNRIYLKIDRLKFIDQAYFSDPKSTFIPQLEIKDSGGRTQGEDVRQNNGKVVDNYTINQPKGNTYGE